MDTRVFCVYNVARGALLSSKVTVADGANQPLTILQVLVGGLAIDSKSGLWISPLHGIPAVPRLFPFDLIYLNEELRVLDLTEFVPGAEFPPYRREVASALILPSQSLQTTQTETDDHLLICPAEELERQIAAFGNGSPVASRTSPLANSHPPRSPIPEFEPVPRAALGSRFTAPAKAGTAVAVAEKESGPELRANVMERGTAPSPRKTTPIKPAVTAAVSSPDIAPPAPQIQTIGQPGLGKEKPQVSESVLPTIGIEPPRETAVAEMAESPRAASESSSQSQSDAPVISISEVILERPRAAEPPAIGGVRGEAPHGDIEDLFSNWMDTPSLASTWKERSAEPARPPVKRPIAPAVADTSSREANTEAASPPGATDTASQAAPVAQVERVKTEAQIEPAAIKPAMSQLETRPLLEPQAIEASAQSRKLHEEVSVQAKSELSQAQQEIGKAEAVPPTADSSKTTTAPASNAAKAPASTAATAPASPAARVAHPQPRQASTSTVAQYGMWRTSLPTPVLPVVPPNGTAKEPDSPVVPSESPKEVAKIAPDAAAQVSTRKASTASVSVEQSVSSASTPRVEAAIQSPTPPVARVSKDAQPIPPKPSGQVAKAGPAKTPEAVSRRPVVPDNFLAADERRKPLDKIEISATPEKSSAEELVRSVVEKTSTNLPSLPTRAMATEAVDIVQRRLGIGQANAAEPATADMQKTESAKVEETVHAQVEPLKSVQALDLGTHKESALHSPSSLVPSEIEIATQNGKSKAPSGRLEANGKASAPPRTLAERFKRWLNPEAKANSDRRRAHRRYVPGMVAHYYTGGAPKPHDIADISMTGFYLLTEDRWMPDTMIQMTLQKPCAKGERKQSITVLSRIVRRGSDGVAAQFVMPESLDPHSHDVQPSQTTDRFALARFI